MYGGVTSTDTIPKGYDYRTYVQLLVHLVGQIGFTKLLKCVIIIIELEDPREYVSTKYPTTVSLHKTY
jgi:hypothetical protein